MSSPYLRGVPGNVLQCLRGTEECLRNLVSDSDIFSILRFWKMALTLTGLKLQGALGRFGKTAVSDIIGFVELPDGKVSKKK